MMAEQVPDGSRGRIETADNTAASATMPEKISDNVELRDGAFVLGRCHRLSFRVQLNSGGLQESYRCHTAKAKENRIKNLRRVLGFDELDGGAAAIVFDACNI